MVEKFNFKITEFIKSSSNIATTSKSKFKKTNKLKIWITDGLLIQLKIDKNLKHLLI